MVYLLILERWAHVLKTELLIIVGCLNIGVRYLLCCFCLSCNGYLEKCFFSFLLEFFFGQALIDLQCLGSWFLCRLYFTKVKLGSPPKEFNVQIDTGSDILWVTCNSCSDCPQSSALGVRFCLLNLFLWWPFIVLILWHKEAILYLHFVFWCRFSSISLMLLAHQLLHWCRAQIQCALLHCKVQPLFALLRIISAVTLFNMEMEVGHRVIMCLMHFILTWFLGNLWWLTLQQPLFSGKLPWLLQEWCL